MQNWDTSKIIKIVVGIVCLIFILQLLFPSQSSPPPQATGPKIESKKPQTKQPTSNPQTFKYPPLSEKFFLERFESEQNLDSFTDQGIPIYAEKLSQNEVVSAIGTLSKWESESGKPFLEFYQKDEGEFILLPQMDQVRRITAYHFNAKIVGEARAKRLSNFLYASMTHPCERSLNNDPEQFKAQFSHLFTPNSPLNAGKYIKPDHVILDIGAFNGKGTLALAPFGRMTIAFDPNPWVFPVLYENARINPQFNIHPFNYGISNHEGDDRFTHSSPEGYGICDMRQSHPSQNIATSLFKVLELKPFLKLYFEESISQIGFIKIDVGGGDFNVLNWISPLLWDAQPVIWIKWPARSLAFDIIESATNIGYYAARFSDPTKKIDRDSEREDGELVLIPDGANLDNILYNWDA